MLKCSQDRATGTSVNTELIQKLIFFSLFYQGLP